ncbi:hypothetical protein SLEP1_g57743 [Rubroshorea leprosula]|uniref:Uncharacterized protein n=1 Tax=Rubroshorea leprosula TaxID=152421 RepID=A0AAV5MR54_9ROSI|nr:hypothetical protein SLEP1_g57743 [Rubroshorea leprosula]
MGEVEVTLELALELQEKADLVIKADNPHAGYTYEDVSFRVSFADLKKCHNPFADLEEYSNSFNRYSVELVESISVAGSMSDTELEIGT